MRDEANSVFLSHPGDSSFLADATDFRHVRLHDIKRARLQPGLKRLSACQDLATCDGNRRPAAQFDVIVHRIRSQRLFKPGDIVVGQHLRRSQRPLVALRPEGIAASGIHHHQRVRADGFPRRANDRLIQFRVVPTKGSPANFERPKSFCFDGAQMIGERFGLLHENRSVGLHALAIASPQQPAHRLACGLTQQVPKSDVNAADGMGDRTAASEPKGVLVQLFADTLRLERVLPAIKRFQDRQRRLHQSIVAEDAAEPDQVLVGVNCDQSVHAILRPQFSAPSAFRRRSKQTCALDLPDFHKAPLLTVPEGISQKTLRSQNSQRNPQGVCKNGSRRGEEADFWRENQFRLVTSAATPLAPVLKLTL